MLKYNKEYTIKIIFCKNIINNAKTTQNFSDLILKSLNNLIILI